jgi:hypothetical protein
MFNGHYYNFVNTLVQFAPAEASASTTTYRGMIGHLATTTSAEEIAFIGSAFGQQVGWFGATDLVTEGTWRYVAGPEVGQGFSQTFWLSGQPDNAGNNEDCLHFISSGWNDRPCTDSIGYYLEFDCPGVLVPGAYGCTRTLSSL